jgi:hypothetical protein
VSASHSLKNELRYSYSFKIFLPYCGLDADGNKIRPEKENKKTGQKKRNKNNNLAQNFL